MNLKSLIARVNPCTRDALEGAAGLCMSRTNYDVEVEHFVLKLLDPEGSDFVQILRRFEVNESTLRRDLTRSLDRMKTGNGRMPSLSTRVVRLLGDAWMRTSIDFEAPQIRTGHVLLALVGEDDNARLAREISAELAKVTPDALASRFADLTCGTMEEKGAAGAAAAAERGTPGAAVKGGALDLYTVDLTGRAREGKLDPVLGRDREVRLMIDILTRKRQNNPILTGEAGVGKTAVVEGFAQRVVSGDVPPPLREIRLHTLDLGLLQAGAGIKGEFENRLKSVIAEVKSSPQPIILFIDEAHTMIGAGGSAGQGDAANLLKPALARGELRTIAATTWSEYKKYFEKDPALARRFQLVKVEEPDEKTAVLMLRAWARSLEKHHGVIILDEAVRSAVSLSHRYISGRQLPDKAVGVLDTACARVTLSQTATPPAIEDLERSLAQLQREIEAFELETRAGMDQGDRVREARAQVEQIQENLQRSRGTWEEEQQLVKQCLAAWDVLRPAAGNGAATADDRSEDLRGSLTNLRSRLAELQGESPLVHPWVDASTIATVIAGWTGIPVGRMVRDEIAGVLALPARLEARVLGQREALEAIAQRIWTAKASLEDTRRPVGVFLLTGPSGVGKTETALAMADLLYGGERSMVTINMSEYQEAHTVSGLKGSPAGYVGYGEGGILTEAVRRRPYTVVLLDEVEKAHPDVLELFYQVFDKGTLEDAEGREIDFKNTVIMLTSNVGTETIMKLCADPETRPQAAGLVSALKPDLEKVFKPAFLGRLIVVPYYPLAVETMQGIIRLQLDRVAERLKENHGARLSYGEEVVAKILARCTDASAGARNIDQNLTRTLLPSISTEILQAVVSGRPFREVRVLVADDGFRYEVE